MVVPNVAMPHVLWQLQGVRTVKMVEEADPHEKGKTVHRFAGFEQVTPGYDEPAGVRYAGRRPGRLHELDGRTGARRAQAPGCDRVAVPVHIRFPGLAIERFLLERCKVI
jgi:hypothetical protein